MSSHSLLQGTFATQGSNPGLPNCGQILHRLSHQGSPVVNPWRKVKKGLTKLWEGVLSVEGGLWWGKGYFNVSEALLMLFIYQGAGYTLSSCDYILDTFLHIILHNKNYWNQVRKKSSQFFTQLKVLLQGMNARERSNRWAWGNRGFLATENHRERVFGWEWVSSAFWFLHLPGGPEARFWHLERLCWF